MATRALKKLAPYWFTPETEKDLPNPAQFHIKPLTPPEKEDCMVIENGKILIPFRNWGRVIGHGLIGWRNHMNDAGTAEATFCQNEIDMLPLNLRMEIASEIISNSELTEDEIKN